MQTPGDTFHQSLLWSNVIRFGIVPVLIVFYVTVAFHYDYTPDDTYIYLHYARHVAQGEGFSFNNGTPAYGVTSPLWVLLISVGTFGGLDPYIVAKTLDLFFACLAIMVFYFTAFGVVRDKIYAFFAVVVFSVDSWLVRWAGSGMETSLAVLLSLLSIWYVYRSEYVLASLVSGVLTLVRPEGAILFMAILVDNFFVSDKGTRPRAIVHSILAYGIVLMPWLVYALWTFGTVVPNTLAARTMDPYSLASLSSVAWSEAKIVFAAEGTCLAFLVFGLLVSLRRIPWKALRLELFPLFWAGAVLAFYVVANVQVVSRYLLIVSPVLIMFGFWGLKRMQEFLKMNWSRTVTLLMVATVLSVAQNKVVYYLSITPHLEGFAFGMTNGLRPIAYWIRDNTNPQATIVAPDIGLLAYVSGRNFYDTAGLVTPQIRHAFAGKSYDAAMEERRYEEVLDPDFVVDRAPIPDRLASDDLVPVMNRRFPGLGITKPGDVYYTLYRGRKK